MTNIASAHAGPAGGHAQQCRALVTGGSGDIGAAIARRLGQAGCQVWVHARSNLAQAQAVADDIVAATQ